MELQPAQFPAGVQPSAGRRQPAEHKRGQPEHDDVYCKFATGLVPVAGHVVYLLVNVRVVLRQPDHERKHELHQRRQLCADAQSVQQVHADCADTGAGDQQTEGPGQGAGVGGDGVVLLHGERAKLEAAAAAVLRPGHSAYGQGVHEHRPVIAAGVVQPAVQLVGSGGKRKGAQLATGEAAVGPADAELHRAVEAHYVAPSGRGCDRICNKDVSDTHTELLLREQFNPRRALGAQGLRAEQGALRIRRLVGV